MAAIPLVLSGPTAMADPSTLVTPSIKLDASGDIMQIEGSLLGHQELVVQAVMTIARGGKSGMVNMKQMREIQLMPGVREVVAKTGLSFNPDDQLIVTLVIEIEGQEISRVEEILPSL